MRGIIDRLDLLYCPNSSDDTVVLRMIDYKTGKAPELKYASHTNERIQQEAFYQLLIYALLYHETFGRASGSPPVCFLRLFYLTSHSDSVEANDCPGVFWDLDLGSSQNERNELLNKIHADLVMVWQAINDMVAEQDPKVFYGCNRTFCFCHRCRSMFPAGTVWEP